MKQLLLLAGFLSFMLNAAAQPARQLSARVDMLRALLARAGTLSPFDDGDGTAIDSIGDVNNRIGEELAALLTMDAVTALDLDSLLSISGLPKAHSRDRRLWIFSWYENTGGSWKSYTSLLHYRSRKGRPRIAGPFYSGTGEMAEGDSTAPFLTNGASFDTIYRLPAKGRSLYLCLGTGISCNTCEYAVASVAELTGEGISFSYPAFPEKGGHDELPGSQSPACLTLEARTGDIETFRYDPATATLILVYRPDDRTPVQGKRKVGERWKFDGIRFREMTK